MVDQVLRDQAALKGIEDVFVDGNGRRHEVSEQTLRRLLEALGPQSAAHAGQAVCTRTCFLPPHLAEGGRLWGMSLQLYGLRSSTNWGIGDFTDLAELAEMAGAAGVAALQLSPLHALFSARPAHCAPYSPSSRLMLNPLYIDVAAVPEFQHSAAGQRYLKGPQFVQRLDQLRRQPGVDYPGVAALKQPALRIAFEEFMARDAAQETARFQDFLAFCRQGGQALADFALFEVLDQRMHREYPGGWQSWPAEFRSPGTAACREFAAGHQRELFYPMYLQWLARTQLAQAQQRGRDAGMPIGLMADLAVGVDPIGADAWRDQNLLALDVEVGAPPDAFADQGQAWGLPPWRPSTLATRDHEPWRALLMANMRDVGGLRVDHVIGLERQFWVPRGLTGRDGAYVRYPREALLDVLAECSRQSGCLVIGEDLGTVPAGFSKRLEDCSILSTRVLRFERYSNGLFARPDTYPSLACACAGTHDLAPLAAWMTVDSRLADDAGEMELLDAALADAGVSSGSDDLDARIAAVHGFLAATPCALVLVQLEDVLAEYQPANQPGTGAEQPNWQRKYSCDLARLAQLAGWRITTDLFRTAGRARHAA